MASSVVTIGLRQRVTQSDYRSSKACNPSAHRCKQSNRSELLQARGMNRVSHLDGLAGDELFEVVRRALVGRDDICNDLLEALVDPGRVERLTERCIEPADDRLGGALREEQSKPGADIKRGKA